MNRLALFGAVAFVSAGVAGPLLLSTETNGQQSGRAADFAINNVTTSLYHEFGHLLIDQFEWPVLGREENAADTIMTMLLLDEGEAATAIAEDAVRGYMLASKRYGETLPENLDVKGEHELELQRGFLMTCLLVGTERERFEALAREIELGDNRTEACREDARLARRSWDALLDDLDIDEDDIEPDEPLGEPMRVEYGDAGETYAAIAGLMKERRLLETVAMRLSSRFPLRREATITAELCGDDDAYYGRDKITLCYEYTQFYFDLIANFERAGEGMI